jgi:CRISPR-associated protein Cas1
MLYGLVESALIRAGLDPAVGVMHRDEYNRPVFTYDFIEPYRGWADYVVCHLCAQEVIFDEFFDRPPNGSWWLNASGKRILVQSFNDYLGEVVSLDGLSRSRLTHLDLDAQRVAARLKNIDP